MDALVYGHGKPPSKNQLQRQLDRPWSPYLIKRIECAIADAATGEALRQILCGESELRIGCAGGSEIAHRRSEIGMIQDIEQLGAELQFESFAQ